MLGMAQRLFLERHSQTGPLKAQRWPLLQQLLNEKWISSTDLALAEMLLKNYPEVDECVACFLCYQSLAMRSGNICTSPEGRFLLQNEEESDLLAQFNSAIREGRKRLPSGLVTQVTSTSDPKTPLCYEDGRTYFQRYWVLEKRFLEHFKSLSSSTPTLQVDLGNVQKRIAELRDKLLPEQGEAILHACRHSLTLFCGGPGTGKTYTIGHFLRLFLDVLAAPCEIALAAPTGKAAMHLEKSLRNHFPEKSFKATTLHALLGVGSREKPPLTADLVIVDESSMIDLKLMTMLFASLKPGARLILVGDRYQLAPVELGALFSDLVAYSPKDRVELKTCLRAESQQLVHLSQAILEGDSSKVMQLLEDDKSISYRTIEDEYACAKEITKELLSSKKGVPLLSPLRKGPLGVDTLNELCVNPQMREVPIMITRSDKKLDLFNGEIGTLIRGDGKDYALFGTRRIPALLLPPYEYAFCLSIYKSQGSEFDEVWIVLPEGSALFGRELLYTAVTRARRKLTIWAKQEVIEQTIARRVQRESKLSLTQHSFS